MNHLSDFVQSEAQTAPKTARGRRTREKLLEAAKVEFGERGYYEAAINRITENAGVAMGTFYVHFPSKEAIFRALVEYMAHVTRRWIAERVADAPDRITAERQGIAAFIDFVRGHQDLYRIVNEAQFVAPDAYRAYYSTFADGYVRRLNDAVERGEISAGDAEARAWTLMGASVFLGQRYGIWEDTAPSDEVLKAAGDLIDFGLRPR